MVLNKLDQILEEKFTSIFRKGYVNVRGFTMPQRYLDMQKEIDDFAVNEEDVWICSFPKTGTTWTQEMVWMIANNLDFVAGRENLGSRSPFLEVSAVFDFRDLEKNNPEFNPPPFIKDSLAFVKNAKGPLCLKTHLPWELLPQKIQTGAKKPKIIYVTRNPKDTCTSYYHHCRTLEGFNGDFEEFTELFLAGKVSFGPYWKHVLAFWKRRNEPNILFLRYEDMKSDLPAVIRKVADFLNKPLNDQQVEILNKHLSFESMKQNKAVNYEVIFEFHKKFDLIKHEGTFMRSGTVGSHKSNMSEEIIAKFDAWSQKNTKNSDYVL